MSKFSKYFSLIRRRFSLLIALVIVAPVYMQAQEIRMEKYRIGEGLRFTNNKDITNSDYSISITGFAQPQYQLTYFTDPEIAQAYSRFRMRRLRLRLNGAAAQQKLTWRIQIDLTGNIEGDNSADRFLTDAWIGYQVTKQVRVRVGQKNTATDNRQLLIRSHTLQLVERSRVTSAFSSIREFGVFIDGNFKTGIRSRLRPSIVISNGDGPNVFTADFGGFKYGGRVDFLPFGTFTNMGQYHEVDMMRELTPKLVIGAAYSYNYGQSSRRGRESGAILYLDDQDNYLLPDFGKLCVDFMFKYRGFSAIGEFVSTTASVPEGITQRVRNDGTTSTNFEVGGVQDVENYIKGRMMLGMGYNIQMGYLFKNRISIDARYAHLDADQHSFLNNGTFYNRPNYYTLGISKYLSKMYGFKVQTSITYVDVADGSNFYNGEPMNGNEWLFRIITSIAF